ncbi:hypothetical protein ABW20_dc0109949 [Dactylellina cionopaga]|nr:hypothetical protein ABW20_dc0109949 [Dactylellina cionopaga]
MTVRNLTGRDPLYEYISPLGQGGFGTVVKVRRISDGTIMACKTIDCSHNPTILRLVSREIQVWSSFALSERYIANFSHDAAWTARSNVMKLYMQFYEGGDLQGAIDRCRHDDHQAVHPFMATYWAAEIAKGIKACHDYNIIHRDIKPANILLAIPYNFNDMLWALSNGETLTESQIPLAMQFSTWLESRPPWCHITDFGFGKLTNAARAPQQYTPASFVAGTMGTSGFIAPECLGENKIFSVKSDVYSLGCVLYTLCTCTYPPVLTNSGATPSWLPIPAEYPRRLAGLVSRCIDPNLDNRPNSREVANELTEAQLDVFGDARYGLMREKISAALRNTAGPSINPPSVINNITHNLETLNIQEDISNSELNNKLRRALFKENKENMKEALAAGADVNISASNFNFPTIWTFDRAFWAGRSRALRLSTETGCDISLLTFALATGKLECVSVLLDYDADFDLHDEKQNPLFIAATYNQSDIVEFLVIARGFDVNYQIPDTGFSALSLAASMGYSDVVKALLAMHAKPFITTPGGDTALHAIGKGKGRVDITSLQDCLTLVLDSAGYLVNLCNKAGDTPLHSVISSGSSASIDKVLAIIRVLKKYGGDLYFENLEKKTAVEVAESSGYKAEDRDSIITLLKSPVPNPNPRFFSDFALTAGQPRRLV